MPTQNEIQRRRDRAQLQSDLRRRRAMEREDIRSDRRQAYETNRANRINARDAIRGMAGNEAASRYMTGRSVGGAPGLAASRASGQGLSVNDYIAQRNQFASDDAVRYATRTNADANHLTGRGNLLAGQGAAADPFERTRQAEVSASASRYVADRQLQGTYDTNDAARQGNVLSHDLGYRQVGGQENVAAMQLAAQQQYAPTRQDFVTTDNGIVIDPNTGQVYNEARLNAMADQQAQPEQQQSAIDDLIGKYPAAADEALQEAIAQLVDNGSAASAEEAEALLDQDPGLFERLLLDRVHGKARGREFLGGDINPFNSRFWANTDPLTGRPMGGFTERVFN